MNALIKILVGRLESLGAEVRVLENMIEFRDVFTNLRDAAWAQIARVPGEDESPDFISGGMNTIFRLAAIQECPSVVKLSNKGAGTLVKIPFDLYLTDEELEALDPGELVEFVASAQVLGIPYSWKLFDHDPYFPTTATSRKACAKIREWADIQDEIDEWDHF